MRFEHPSLRQGLVGAWCPSIGGTLADRSGRGNYAPNGGLAIEAQRGFMCMTNRLGGSSSSLLAAPLLGDVEATISMYARQDNTSFTVLGGVGTSGTTGSGFIITTNGASSFQLNVTGQAFGSGTVPSLAAWAHLCAVKMPGPLNTTTRLFFNGTEVAGSSSSAVVPNVLSSRFFLCDYGANIGTFRGTTAIDDVRLYNRALTLSEIRLLASRRGIGLSPLPDRAVSLPRKLSINVGGTWRPADAYVHDGTAFRLSEAKINVGGVWK
jgi:hypothetical protein